jgi:type I restriction enzyme S subunit
METKVQWPIKRLGELAEFRNGVNYNKSSFGKGVKVVGVSDFQDYTKPRYDELDQINPEGIVSDRNILKDGDIVFVRSNGNRELIGRSLFIERPPEDITHSAFTIRLRFNSREVHPKYYAYCFRTPLIRKGLTAQGGGTNINNLNQDILNALEVPVPPLPEQKRIAGILSAYDELIENSQRRIKILETMARNLYREWFIHYRFPGHENIPLIPSPLGNIPKGWEAKPLEAVCDRITDGSHQSPPSVDDGYPMASVKDMHDWGIHIESCRKIGAKDYENLVRNNCKPLKNDVLIAKDGSYLKHTFVVGEEQDLVILSSIAVLRPNSSIRPNYLSFTLREPTTRARMAGFVSGVAIPRIVLKDFRKFMILVPTIEIQEGWSEQVDPIVDLCRALISQIQNLRKTRDLLLPRLLSGQIPLNTPATEVA